MGKRLYCGFHGKEWAQQYKQLGLAGLNNFSGLWAIEMVPCCLVPSPGWSEQRNIASWSVSPSKGRQVEVLTQDGLVCISKAPSQVSGSYL